MKEMNSGKGSEIRSTASLFGKVWGLPVPSEGAAGHSVFYYIINLDPSGFKERGSWK